MARDDLGGQGTEPRAHARRMHLRRQGATGATKAAPGASAPENSKRASRRGFVRERGGSGPRLDDPITFGTFRMPLASRNLTCKDVSGLVATLTLAAVNSRGKEAQQGRPSAALSR